VAHVIAVSGFCILDGFNIPFTATQLAPLYRNHGAYQPLRPGCRNAGPQRDASEAVSRAANAAVR
jgi:hypothetical protein